MSGNKKLLLRFLAWFSLANTVIFWLIGSRYLVAILSSGTLFRTTFYAYHTLFGKSIVLAFTALTFLGHFTLLACLPALLCLVPLFFLSRRPLIIISIAIMVSTTATIVLFADSIVFQVFHFHLNSTLINVAFSERLAFIKFFSLSTDEISLILSAMLAILIIEIGLATLIWKKIVLADRLKVEKTILSFLALCLFLSYAQFITSATHNNNVLAQQTPNLPLYNFILASILPIKNSHALIGRFSETRFSQPLFSPEPLHYPLKPLQCKLRQAPYNIVMIGIDTWRFDAMTAELTPNIYQFAKQSWQFTQHQSGGNSTQAGLFTLFYGLPSNYWGSMLKQKTGAIFINELLAQHYQTKVLFSADIDIPPFDKTIFSSLKNLTDSYAEGDTPAQRDTFITNKFLEFIAQYDHKQPFFAFLFYDATHGYCANTGIKKVYPIGSENCDRIFTMKHAKQEVINHYKNSVYFVDSEVQRVLETLKNNGLLQNTIVMITGDHGEEFNDTKQDYWGHSSNYTRYQIQTPLIIYQPNSTPQTINYQTSHYDVAPFLLSDVLGCSNPPADYSIGSDLFTAKNPPFLLIGSYINMGIVAKDSITTLLTSGDIVVSDQNAKVLPDAKPDLANIKQALLEMRKYYSHHTG